MNGDLVLLLRALVKLVDVLTAIGNQALKEMRA